MPSTTNVAVGKPKVAGGAFRAPLGTAVPADGTTALNAAFKNLGFVGEDGLTFSPSRSTDKRKAWGGQTVKVLQTDYSETWSLTLIEYRNSDVQKSVFGDANVTTTAATSSAGTKVNVKHTAAVLPNGTWVFEMQEGAATTRVVLPNAQITEVGDVTYSDEEIVGYEVTLEAFADATGVNSYEYTDDGVLAP
jgi:hypothetical protein